MMAHEVSSFKFTAGQLDLFAQASSDYNKLHADEIFASKSIFGKRVVFGIATLLKVLNELPIPAGYRLCRLKTEFKKPLLVGDVAHVEVLQLNSQGTKVHVLHANDVILKISFDWLLEDENALLGLQTKKILGNSNIDHMIGQPSASDYCVNDAQLDILKKALDLKKFILPLPQIQFLLWTSYFVGMVYPGEEALYSQLEINDAQSDFAFIQLKTLVKDERFSLSTLTGEFGTDRQEVLASFKIKSMHLKKPLKTQSHDVKKNPTPIFENKKGLILGGSRGFGAALALQFSVQGADVDLTYARNKESAFEIQKQIQEQGRSSNIFSLDLGNTSDVNLFLEAHTKHSYDVIVLNAMTLIQKKNFAQYDVDSFTNKFNLDLTLNLNSLIVAKKLLKPHGHIVYVSSTYVDSAESGFSVYTALKSAVEALIRADHNESRDFSYSIFRLPKMLTDQTNSPLITGPIHKTTDLSYALIDHLSRQMSAFQPFQITRLGD